MPLAYSIDERHALLIVRTSGTVRGNDIIELIHGCLSDPLWKPTLDVLWDGRQTREMSMDWSEFTTIRSVVLEYADRVGPGRVAVVSTRIAVKSLAEMYSVYMRRFSKRNRDRETRVFQTIPPAAEWLGLEEAELHELITSTTT